MWRSGKRKQPKSDFQRLVARADTVFSKYIRLRDAIETPYGLYFRCISCGKLKPIAQADCGHYINRRHMSARYSEINCNAQCRECNRFDEGNLSGYREKLVMKYGEARVQLLESCRYQTAKIGTFELKILIDEYREKVKQLEKEKGKLSAI